ncbi:MAG: zonular occludens toxin domain-containing protein [Candidatus Nanohaloarchaea archaeon]
MTEKTYEEVKHSHPLVENIQKRLYKLNKNWLSIVTGPTGSGKSWSALSLAEKIDPDFNEEKVILRPENFMKKLANKEWGQGDVVIFDEAGAGMSAKEHMTKKNRVMDQVLQTFRRQNIAVIFTVPSKANVDKSVRRLLHTYIETKTIDYVNERNHLKWLKMDYNRKMDKIYYKYPRIKESNGSTKKVKTVKMGKPSQELIDSYEDKRSRYQRRKNNELAEEIEKALQDAEKDETKSKKDKIKEDLEDDPDISTKELAKKYDTDESYVSQVKSQV